MCEAVVEGVMVEEPKRGCVGVVVCERKLKSESRSFVDGAWSVHAPTMTPAHDKGSRERHALRVNSTGDSSTALATITRSM